MECSPDTSHQHNIPKVIHYCWFGHNPIPADVERCIESWKTHCPGYEIIQWNESNYDVHKIPYISQAYNAKKWAFVSDYARLDILYTYGGIYMDTDVQLLKSLDALLCHKAYMGLEEAGCVNSGLGMGAQKEFALLAEIIQYYESAVFLLPNGTYNTLSCVEITSELLRRKGLSHTNAYQELDGLVIYPTEYLCPIRPGSRKAMVTTNTYSIHHYTASWYEETKWRKELKYRLIPIKKLARRLIGDGNWNKLRSRKR